MKELAIFDLDGTLAESKSALDQEMASLLGALLDVVKVAIISGGDWPQFEKQVVSKLDPGQKLANLSLLPTCGTKFYRYETAWQQLYSEDFSEAERNAVSAALRQVLGSPELDIGQIWGEQIEDRGSQITLWALGQTAPLDDKQRWDPDFAKRQRLKARLEQLLPGFSIRLGGTTSIDVTKAGIDKAYGIRKLRDILGIGIGQMVFVGDALFPGGNDYPAKEAGVVSIQVKGPDETKCVVSAILAVLSDVSA